MYVCMCVCVLNVQSAKSNGKERSLPGGCYNVMWIWCDGYNLGAICFGPSTQHPSTPFSIITLKKDSCSIFLVADRCVLDAWGIHRKVQSCTYLGPSFQNGRVGKWLLSSFCTFRYHNLLVGVMLYYRLHQNDSRGQNSQRHISSTVLKSPCYQSQFTANTFIKFFALLCTPLAL